MRGRRRKNEYDDTYVRMVSTITKKLDRNVMSFGREISWYDFNVEKYGLDSGKKECTDENAEVDDWRTNTKIYEKNDYLSRREMVSNPCEGRHGSEDLLRWTNYERQPHRTTRREKRRKRLKRGTVLTSDMRKKRKICVEVY